MFFLLCNVINISNWFLSSISMDHLYHIDSHEADDWPPRSKLVEEGMNSSLYHGISRTQTFTKWTVRQLRRRLGTSPFYIDNPEDSREIPWYSHCWMEKPMSNHHLFSGFLKWGVASKYIKIHPFIDLDYPWNSTILGIPMASWNHPKRFRGSLPGPSCASWPSAKVIDALRTVDSRGSGSGPGWNRGNCWGII